LPPDDAWSASDDVVVDEMGVCLAAKELLTRHLIFVLECLAVLVVQCKFKNVSQRVKTKLLAHKNAHRSLAARVLSSVCMLPSSVSQTVVIVHNDVMGAHFEMDVQQLTCSERNADSCQHNFVRILCILVLRLRYGDPDTAVLMLLHLQATQKQKM
jgi:hypothetical protein